MAPAGTAVMFTEAITFGFTVMVTVFEVTGLPVTHEALDVMMHRTRLLFVRPASVYVEPVPTLVPFFCHW